jgi:hypothetical protein
MKNSCNVDGRLWSWTIQIDVYRMAPPKNLVKLFKYKPRPQLNMDDVPMVEKEKLSEWVRPKPVIPEPTPQELVAWARARELQKVDEAGNPAEGWAARIETMKADGRLWYCEEDGMWHRRGIEG